MRAFIALEQRFLENGQDFYADASVDYSFWVRYLDVFDRVTIIARSKKVTVVPEQCPRSTGPGVDHFSMPYYEGPKEYLLQSSALWNSSRLVSLQKGAFILRVPGSIGTLVWIHLKRLGKPYALEVVGDPADSLSPLIWSSKLMKPIRWLSQTALRRQCHEAMAGIAYVSRVLGQKYPPGQNATNISYIPTGIEVPNFDNGLDVEAAKNMKAALTTVPTTSRPERRRMVFVGTLEALYKGQEYLLKALRRMLDTGLDIELEVIGDGRFRPSLEALAHDLGLGERVRFSGKITERREVFEKLRSSHLFLLPSLAEGLPRALIEAMALGLPCIATSVGGIPELLPKEDLVPPADANRLAEKIIEVLQNPERMHRMSERNRGTAQQYRTEALRKQRIRFYEDVSKITERFQNKY